MYLLRLVDPDGEQYEAEYEQSYVKKKSPCLVDRFESVRLLETQKRRLSKHLEWRKCRGDRVRFLVSTPPSSVDVLSSVPILHQRPFFTSMSDFVSEERRMKRNPFAGRRCNVRGPPSECSLLLHAPSAFEDLPISSESRLDSSSARFFLCLPWDPPTSAELELQEGAQAKAIEQRKLQLAQGHVDSCGRLVYDLDLNASSADSFSAVFSGGVSQGVNTASAGSIAERPKQDTELDGLKVINIETILSCRGSLLPDPQVDAVIGVRTCPTALNELIISYRLYYTSNGTASLYAVERF
jgi:hypothetical protein